jgi:predicted transcriptional regulator of viral defense system
MLDETHGLADIPVERNATSCAALPNKESISIKNSLHSMCWQLLVGGIYHQLYIDKCNETYHIRSMEKPASQHDRAVSLLSQRGMARLSEFIENGVTATTVSRMEQKGVIVQLGRGLYQLADALLDANHSLAEAAKLVPRGVICLGSALAFHELTDRIPGRIWVAIGSRDWRPNITHPPIEIVRFGLNALEDGIETHVIEQVPVRIYSPAKTIIDVFRHAARRRNGGKTSHMEALRAMKEALRVSKATPADIARYAHQAGVWKTVRPYLEALTVDA